MSSDILGPKGILGSSEGGGGGGGSSESIEIPLGEVSGTITVNLALGTTFTATLIGNTVFKFINAPAGYTPITFFLTQDATAGRTFSFETLVWSEGEPPFRISIPHERHIIQVLSFKAGAVFIGVGAIEGKEGAEGAKGATGATGPRGPEGVGGELLKFETVTLGPGVSSLGSPYSPKIEAALRADGTVTFVGLLALSEEKTGGSLILTLPEKLWPKFQKLMVVGDGDAAPNEKSFLFVVKKNGEVTTAFAINSSQNPSLDGTFYSREN